MKTTPRMAMPLFPVCLACVMAVVLLSSCTKVGPKSIRKTRFDYNSAIIDTRNEQMLANLVRLRYRDTPYFIEVSSVATQYALGVAGSASVGGIGGPGSKAVGGVGGDVYYEDRPTITYTPLQGETFVNRPLSPVPMGAIVLLSHSGWRFERLLRCRFPIMTPTSAASSPTHSTTLPKARAQNEARRTRPQPSWRRARLLPPFPNELGSRGRRRMTAERQPGWGRTTSKEYLHSNLEEAQAV